MPPVCQCALGRLRRRLGAAGDVGVGGDGGRELLPVFLRAHAIDARDEEIQRIVPVERDVPIGEPLLRLAPERTVGVVADERRERERRALVLVPRGVRLREGVEGLRRRIGLGLL